MHYRLTACVLKLGLGGLVALVLGSTPVAAEEGRSTLEASLPECEAAIDAPCLLPTPAAALVEAGTRGHLIGIWMAEGVLNVAVRGLSEPVTLCCQLRARLAPVAGSPYQAVGIRLPEGQRAPIKLQLFSGRRLLVAQTWPSPSSHAPRALQAGRIEQIELPNTARAGASRRVSLYRPDGYEADPERLVVYMADGQALEGYAQELDALLVAGSAPKILLVGIWSDPSQRGQEYLPAGGGRGAAFGEHASFLLDVVAPHAEQTWRAPSDPRRRVVFGTSDGGVWALAMAADRPALFPNVLALSPGWSPVLQRFNTGRPQRVFLGAGTEEAPQRRLMLRASQALKGSDLCFSWAPGGHTQEVWRKLFAEGVQWLSRSNFSCLPD